MAKFSRCSFKLFRGFSTQTDFATVRAHIEGDNLDNRKLIGLAIVYCHLTVPCVLFAEKVANHGHSGEGNAFGAGSSICSIRLNST